MQKKGVFITFEGGEGSGKSTQIKLFAQYLQEKGQDVIITREPGATESGKQIRRLLVEGDKDKFDELTETLLFYADRRINLTKIVKPALESGKIVLSDRHNDSTLAYQFYGAGKFKDTQIMDTLYALVTKDAPTPELTFLLDIAPEIGLKRSFAKAETMSNKELRFEDKELDFHNRLRQGYLTLAAKHKNRIKIINANQPQQAVLNDIIKAYENFINKA